MTDSSLLIGGPKDGHVLAFEDPTVPFFVAKIDLFNLYDVEAEFPTEPVTVQRETYYPETVVFFDLALRVHVHESLIGSPSVRERIATHLLSEKGKAVLAV